MVDGIFAVATALLVLDLKLPAGVTLKSDAGSGLCASRLPCCE
ncbi:MAG: hypothetical protein JOZ31_23135 [Verrucomicrobia bacterium]|nr:hypothetical protein [Verrucomicrobiota bacterium]MBV8481390.1 hypothetical protein [Verrucomicrobiota bacterium]